MRSTSKLLCALLLSVSVIGCQTVNTAPEATAERPLLSPDTLGRELEATQIVRGAFGEHEATLRCAIVVKRGTMTVVGLTALGIRAFTLSYDGHDIQHDEAVGTPAQLTPERLLADLQLVYWPLTPLQLRLREQGWEVTEPFAGTRRLKRNGRLVAEVHYDTGDPWSGRAWLANLQYGYTLSIESLIS